MKEVLESKLTPECAALVRATSPPFNHLENELGGYMFPVSFSVPRNSARFLLYSLNKAEIMDKHEIKNRLLYTVSVSYVSGTPCSPAAVAEGIQAEQIGTGQETANFCFPKMGYLSQLHTRTDLLDGSVTLEFRSPRCHASVIVEPVDVVFIDSSEAVFRRNGRNTEITAEVSGEGDSIRTFFSLLEDRPNEQL